MRNSGRVSLVTILALLGIVVMVAILSFSKEGPGPTGTRFMDALTRGDAQTLTNLSYLGTKSPEEIRKDWDFTTQVPGKYYRFRWRVLDSTQSDPQNGAVRVMVERNIGSGSSFEEKFELPMRLIDGKWKVDVAGINREMYPGLPKSGK